MGLGDLTDSAAVRAAVAEFDEIGRDAFLARYGFGQARGYFLRLNGKDYDSKAIAGVAHGKQFPGLGPLLPSEFTGGANTVVKKLESLGFEVTHP